MNFLDWKCPKCKERFPEGTIRIHHVKGFNGKDICFDCAMKLEPERVSRITWDCITCTEEFKAIEGRPVIIDSSEVCKSCVRSMFEKAYDNEANWPPRWGEIILKIDWFEEVFPADVIARYQAREDGHYRVPVNDRVYCEGACGNYLGSLTKADEAGVASRIFAFAKCHCHKVYCLRCAKQMTSPDDAFSHDTCDKDRKQRKAVRDKALQGQTRGKDYQLCPKCERAVHLTEACNEMACPCGTSFCYVCGKRVGAGSKHFGSGGCPRFSGTGGEAAIFDGDESDESDESDDDDDDDDDDGDTALDEFTELRDQLLARLASLQEMGAAMLPAAANASGITRRIEAMQEAITMFSEG